MSFIVPYREWNLKCRWDREILVPWWEGLLVQQDCLVRKCLACLLITVLLQVSCSESHIMRHYQVSECGFGSKGNLFSGQQKYCPSKIAVEHGYLQSFWRLWQSLELFQLFFGSKYLYHCWWYFSFTEPKRCHSQGALSGSNIQPLLASLVSTVTYSAIMLDF